MNTNVLRETIAAFYEFARANYRANSICQPQKPEEMEFAKALVTLRMQVPAERADLQAVIGDPYSAHYLANFAVRCASFALQKRDVDHIGHGALALVLDADVLDPRDLLGALGVLNEAASRLGIDLFGQIMVSVLELSTEYRRKLVEDFFLNPESHREIEKLGFELIHLEGVPWFRNCQS